jgi:hypothetical protein
MEVGHLHPKHAIGVPSYKVDDVNFALPFVIVTGISRPRLLDVSDEK